AKTRRILASFQESYFSNSDIVKLEQVLEYPEVSEVIALLQIAFNHYTQKEIKLFSILSANMLDAILYGTPIMRVYWNGNKPVLENISIYDVYLDPDATSNEDINYLVHNLYLSKNQIYALIDSGVFQPQNAVQRESEAIKLYTREKIQEVYYRLSGIWYCATMWGNNKLRDTPLQDGLPFVIGRLIPQIFSQDEEAVKLYGESPISIILPLQQEINTRRNQQIDAIDLSLNPRVLLQMGGGIDPVAFKKGAGEIIQCSDPNAVKFFTPPSIAEGTFDIQRLDLEAQEAIGVTAYNSGVHSAQLNQTATGVSVLSSEANTRIQSLIRSYNETFIEPALTRLAHLIYKYDTQFFAQGIYKPPLDLVARINTGLGATNKQLQLQNYQLAFQMFAQIQNYQGMVRVVQDMLSLMGIKNKQDYFNEESLDFKNYQISQGVLNNAE
ncbi:hypothetical protein, partial [Helicobacter sp.]|uniref:portal protein n=1 Tax=Helicobacter sp. TaxID=218 RepID=UPI002A75FDCB